MVLRNVFPQIPQDILTLVVRELQNPLCKPTVDEEGLVPRYWMGTDDGTAQNFGIVRQGHKLSAQIGRRKRTEWNSNRFLCSLETLLDPGS